MTFFVIPFEGDDNSPLNVEIKAIKKSLQIFHIIIQHQIMNEGVVA
jgi:hypothetical protein